LVFWSKPRNRRSDFEAQITKLKLQFWGTNRETLHHLGFEAQPRNPPPVLRPNRKKTVATSFEAKLEKTVATGFEAKPAKTVATSFEAKLEKTVATGFEANQRKPSEWFWGQTTHKPLSSVLRLNQETCPPHLHVHGADHTWCHPTSRSPGNRVPDLCDHPRSSAPGLLLLPRSSSLHAMPHLPPAHHETRKRDSPNETKIKEKQNKTKLSWIRIQTSPSQWLITIKARNWPLGFSISPLMSPLTTKARSLKFKSKTPWSTARRHKKARKAQEGHLEEGKPQKPANDMKSGKAKQNGKEELRKAQKSKKSSNQGKSSKSTLPLTLSMQALPLR
jgi:hypothetical protein